MPQPPATDQPDIKVFTTVQHPAKGVTHDDKVKQIQTKALIIEMYPQEA